MNVYADSNCNLCNGVVGLLRKADKELILHFFALTEKDLNSNTIVVEDNGQRYYRSAAVMHVFKNLKFPWKIFAVFDLLPEKMLDYIYDIIAENRYKWFGSSADCQLPSSPLKSRDNELTQ
jgi:predicted DCC family thiol-disulfide oxidoreductase YuxK